MANSSRTTMGILDVKIATRLGIKTSIVKVAYHENDLFRSTILKALKKYLKSDDEDYNDAAAEIALGRINTIGCNKVREHCNGLTFLLNVSARRSRLLRKVVANKTNCKLAKRTWPRKQQQEMPELIKHLFFMCSNLQ